MERQISGKPTQYTPLRFVPTLTSINKTARSDGSHSKPSLPSPLLIFAQSVERLEYRANLPSVLGIWIDVL
jgi:hypothetical protein